MSAVIDHEPTGTLRLERRPQEGAPTLYAVVITGDGGETEMSCACEHRAREAYEHMLAALAAINRWR